MYRKQIQATRKPDKDSLTKYLQEQTDTIQYLEDGYYVYLRKPERIFDPKHLSELEELLERSFTLYWYAFTFAGKDKLYNVVWGYWRNGKVTVTGGCSYYIDGQAHLRILNKIKELKKRKGYYYLGGGVRNRFAETMNQYLPKHGFDRMGKNRVDISPEAKDMETQLALPLELQKQILDNVVERISRSALASRRAPEACLRHDECDTEEDILENRGCELYFYGDHCFKDKNDLNWNECLHFQIEEDLT